MKAKASEVKYDRGNESRHYYGRRKYVSVVCEDGIERSSGMADGRIIKIGDVIRMSNLGISVNVKFD